MYKNILLPTDGSALSLVAIDNGLQFAKAVGAKVTGFYVMLERQPESFEDYAPVDVKAPKLDEVTKQESEKYLKIIADKARALGVPCKTHSMKHTSPHQAHQPILGVLAEVRKEITPDGPPELLSTALR